MRESKNWFDSIPPYAPSADGPLHALPEPRPVRPPLLWPVREILDHPPSVRWLIRDVVESDSLAMLYGPPASGKSFVAFSMAASIACGVDWHGHRVRRGPVVYLMGEGIAGASRRLRAWQLRNRYAQLENAPLFLSRRMVPLGEADAVAEIVAAIEETGADKPVAVWVDTLARAAGDLDENSARDMGALVRACDAIRQRFGCVVALVHHSGHGQDRARGSSALKAAIDVEISVSKDGPIVTLASTKAKESEGFPGITFRLESVDTLWADEDGNPVYSAVLDTCDAPEQEEQLGKNQSIALAVLRDLIHQREKTGSESSGSRISVRISISDWREASGLNRKRFAEVKKALIEKGLITLTGNFVALVETSERSEGVRNAPSDAWAPKPSETSERPLGLGRSDAALGQAAGGADYEDF
ncbi:helicase RepA family protein [Acidithiobacillus ferriphilus]|uniref:helicase RepA family protein n=1 Tax=Acidithiobacillus ferriphilus TaxID=1689834 RepID=UPI00390CC4DF